MYHYIRNFNKNLPYFNFLDIKKFKKQNNFFSKQKGFIELNDNLGEVYFKNKYLLTFDDGLKEQLKAFNILKEKKIPAIFFISTMPLIENKACFVHKFHYVMEQISFECLYDNVIRIFPDSIQKFHDSEFLKSASLKYVYDKPNCAMVKLYVNFCLSIDNKSLLIDRLFDMLKIDESGFVENLYMDNQDITEIAQEGMLGSHCITHNPLGEMSAIKIKTELNNSKSYLSNITGEEIFSVSYPYGDKKAVTQSVLDISRDYYDIGITTQGGINQNNDLINKKLSLNRISEAEISKGNYI